MGCLNLISVRPQRVACGQAHPQSFDLAKTPENGPTGHLLAAPRRSPGMTFFWVLFDPLAAHRYSGALGARDDRRGRGCFVVAWIGLALALFLSAGPR